MRMAPRLGAVVLAVIAIGMLPIGASAASGPSGPSPKRAAPGSASSSAAASGGFDFGVEPVNHAGTPEREAFIYDAEPGQVIHDQVELINNTAIPKPLYLYGADASLANNGGGFALSSREDPVHDVGAWIALPVTQYTVAPESVAIVPVIFTVPTDASPGDHTGGVVGEELPPPRTATKGANILTVHRVAARVYFRVAGPLRPVLSLQTVHLKKGAPVIPYVTGKESVEVTFIVADTGNTRVQLDSVELSMSALLGGTVDVSTLARASVGHPQPAALPDQLLPGTQVTFRKSFSGLPAIDRLTAHVAVTGQDPISNSPIDVKGSKPYWAVPWWLLLAIAVLAVAIWWWRRWRRRKAAKRAPGPIPA